MIDRRDLLIGIGGLVAAGGSIALRPRNNITLMGDLVIEDVLPKKFDGWAVNPKVGLVLPPTEGSLASRLYTETVGRGYDRVEDRSSGTVMVLISHGAQQSDSLELHRPEACYPAYGFEITDRRLTSLALGSGKSIPSVELTAKLGDRIEDVFYWTRIGEALPQTAGRQREERLRAALAGYVGDGILVRLSIVRSGSAPEHAVLREFARTLLQSIQRDFRIGLIGSRLAG